MAKLVYYINYRTINNDINEDGCGHIFYKKNKKLLENSCFLLHFMKNKEKYLFAKRNHHPRESQVRSIVVSFF